MKIKKNELKLLKEKATYSNRIYIYVEWVNGENSLGNGLN